jgi:hypothetical protein
MDIGRQPRTRVVKMASFDAEQFPNVAADQRGARALAYVPQASAVSQAAVLLARPATSSECRAAT